MSFIAATARQSISRASLRNTSSTFRAGARRMNSSHAAYKPKSDKPWIFGSALLFGPAFLYLVSPSARKNTPHIHNDAHDFPGHKSKAHEPEPTPAAEEAASEPEPVAAAAEPVLVKDDEGTEANIADSLAASAVDVPKAGAVSEEQPSEAAPEAPVEPEAKEPGAPAVKLDGPTDVGEAREAAKEGVEPKKAEGESS